MRCRGSVSVLLGVILASLTLPASALAGTYTVHACQLPSGAPAPATGFTVSYLGANSYESTCKEIGLKRDVAHGHNEGANLTFDSPPGTTIQDYSIWRAAQVQTASAYNYAYELFQGAGGEVRDLLEHCYGQQRCGSIGDFREPLGERSRFKRVGLSNVRQVQLRARCLVAGTCPPTAPNPASLVRVFRADFTLRDDAVPVFSSSPSGTLVDPTRELTGIEQVTIGATDMGGGVYQARFEVDGAIVDTRKLDACEPPFAATVPCPLSVSTTLDFDTARLADGEHRLRILVTDATGTNTAVHGPIRIRTVNAPCRVAATLAASTKLSATFQRGRKTRRVRYGRKVKVHGRLTRRDGAPLPGTPVCVGRRNDAAGATTVTLATVTTGPDGRFTYTVDARTAGWIRLAHRAGDGTVAASAVRLKVPAPVSLRTSRRVLRKGQRLVLRGRVRGRSLPATGVLVELQARRPRGWQTFQTAKADRRGRFRRSYRFTRTVGVQRYKLRARVPRQPVFPYVAGASKAVGVRVRG